jgi:hypothetical protein
LKETFSKFKTFSIKRAISRSFKPLIKKEFLQFFGSLCALRVENGARIDKLFVPFSSSRKVG